MSDPRSPGARTAASHSASGQSESAHSGSAQSESMQAAPSDAAPDKTYRPAEIEAKHYARWEQSGAFRAGRNSGQPYTIVIPPPNLPPTPHLSHPPNTTPQPILIPHT